MRFGTARFVLLFALCAAPFAFGAVEGWAWPVLTLSALVTLAFWGSSCIRKGEVQIHWSPLYVVGALMLALGLAQFFTGLTPDRTATRDAIVLLATDILLFFLARHLFADDSGKVDLQFGRVVAIYAFLLSLFAIFQLFSSHGRIYWSIKPATGDVFGPYVNRNDYAGLMELLIPVAAGYAWTRRDWGRLLALFGVAIALASLLLTGSRGGMAAMLVEATILAFVVFRQKLMTSHRGAAAAGAMALIAGVAISIWMNPGYVPSRMAGMAGFSTAAEVTLGKRLIVTRDAFRIVRDHPWLGTGLGSFIWVFPRYQSFPDNAIWEHAHDDYAEALAETGLIGGLLILAGLVVFFRAALGRFNQRACGPAGWVRLGCATGCCGLLAHSLVDFNLHIPANAAWFAVCLGLATAPPVNTHSSGSAE